MHTSEHWYGYFKNNLTIKRIDWSITPILTNIERRNILKSLQAWQLGETSDGANLIHASTKYANRIGDHCYPKAVELFIKEEQKHGNNLGRYLDMIGEKRIKKNWGDTLFRKVRYFNTSMEIWTLAVITVESTAQIFYQSLKKATNCKLLKQVCTDILIDEAPHIEFQLERMTIIYEQKHALIKIFFYYAYMIAFAGISLLVWFAHRRLFKAGGNTFTSYCKKMALKFDKTFRRMRNASLSPENNTVILR
ncbi:MAG: ferritin-like domain-containing protein [Bacteroidota bacterium]